MSSPERKCEKASHSYNNHNTPQPAMIDPFPTRTIYAHVKTMFLNCLTEGNICWVSIIVAVHWYEIQINKVHS
jgi:hypothetical protein